MIPQFPPCDDSSEVEEIEEPLVRHTSKFVRRTSTSMEIDDTSAFQPENTVPVRISPTQDTPQTPASRPTSGFGAPTIVDAGQMPSSRPTSGFGAPTIVYAGQMPSSRPTSGFGAPTIVDAGQMPSSNRDFEEGQDSTRQHAQHQTKNHRLNRGGSSAPQQAQHQTGSQDDDAGVSTPLLTNVHDPADPARDVVFLVEMLTCFYGIILSYLNWGPTDHSPRQSNTILFWASIVILVYAMGAVIVAKELYKMGDAWAWWASFLSYTIYLVALLGVVVLIILVALH